MNILRRASNRQLIVGILAVLAIAVGTAAAFASRSGPKPPHRSLAAALHRLEKSKPVQGVTARVKFTDNLFPSGSAGALGSGSPLISGATGRIWAGGGKVRLELQSSAGDTEIGFNGSTVTLYDVASGTAYTMAVSHHAHTSSDATRRHAAPTMGEIKRALARLSQNADLTGAIPGDIAGQPSYTVRMSPKHSGGLLGSVELAWDATHGVPLRFAVYSKTDSSPVLSLTVTDISFGKVPASDLAVPMAPGTKVVKVHMPTQPASSASTKGKHQPEVTGMAAVARAVTFRLSAPASVVGLPRHTVRLVSVGGSKSAMAVYGQGLGALVVLEQPVPASAKATHSPLAALPTVSIDGAPAHELDTALGTLIQFDRGGVRYTVVGSLPQAAAEAAARAIG